MPLGIYYNKEVGLGLATEWIEIGEVIMNIAKDLVSVLRPSGLKYPKQVLPHSTDKSRSCDRVD